MIWNGTERFNIFFPLFLVRFNTDQNHHGWHHDGGSVIHPDNPDPRSPPRSPAASILRSLARCIRGRNIERSIRVVHLTYAPTPMDLGFREIRNCLSSTLILPPPPMCGVGTVLPVHHSPSPKVWILDR